MKTVSLSLAAVALAVAGFASAPALADSTTRANQEEFLAIAQGRQTVAPSNVVETRTVAASKLSETDQLFLKLAAERNNQTH